MKYEIKVSLITIDETNHSFVNGTRTVYEGQNAEEALDAMKKVIEYMKEHYIQ